MFSVQCANHFFNLPIINKTSFAGFVITYHKEHLLTEDEVSKVYEHRAVCGVLFSKDATTAIRIAEILDKHGYEEELRNVGGKY